MDWTAWQVHSEWFTWNHMKENWNKSMNSENSDFTCVFWSLSSSSAAWRHCGWTAPWRRHSFEDLSRFPHNVLYNVCWCLLLFDECVVSFWTAIVSVSCFLMLVYSLHTCCSFESSNSPGCICHDGGSRRAIVFWCRVFILDWKNCQWIGGTKNGNIPKYKKSLQFVKSTVEIEAVSYFLTFDVWIHLTKTNVDVNVRYCCHWVPMFCWWTLHAADASTQVWRML